MSRASVISPYQQFYYANSNNVLAGGSVGFYNPGTEVLAKIYSDPGLKIPQENPYTLDAGGMLRGDVRFGSTLTLVTRSISGQEQETIEGMSCFSNDVAFADYSNVEIYSQGDIVTNTDGKYYKSNIDGNLNNDPATNVVAWQVIDFIPAGPSVVDRLVQISELAPTNQSLLIGDGTDWETIPIAEIEPGYIGGMEIAIAADIDHDLTVAIGRCIDSTNALQLTLASALTKQIDATWAAGNNAGGLASGLTVTADTWYHVFVVKTSLYTDVMFDTSVVCANGVSGNGVTHFRRIGSVRTNVSANLLSFFQFGDIFYWGEIILDYNAVGPVTAGALLPLSTPPDVSVKALLQISTVRIAGAGAATYELLTSPDQTNSAPSATLSQLAIPAQSVDNAYGVWAEIQTDTSQQIRIREASGVATQTRILTFGWIDTRGQ